jgi:hypothetical protein
MNILLFHNFLPDSIFIFKFPPPLAHKANINDYVFYLSSFNSKIN